MNKLEQAARQALKALETKGEHHSRVYEAITALREALAEQTKQEPVALSKIEQDAKRYAYMMHPDFFEVCDVNSSLYRYKVGLQPAVKKGFPKPINQCIEGYGETLEEAIDMAIGKTAPVQQVDLTDDEICEIVDKLSRPHFIDFARAVIAAFKEKNK